MSKFYVFLSVIILASDFGIFQSHANFNQQFKVTQKNGRKLRTTTTTQSDYFFDGSGFGGSGFDPEFDDDAEGGNDDDDDEYFTEFGSGADPTFAFPPLHQTTLKPVESPTTTTTATSTTFTMTTTTTTTITTAATTTTEKILPPVTSTVSQVTVDVEPTESKVTVTPEGIVPKKEHGVHHAVPEDGITTPIQSTNTTIVTTLSTTAMVNVTDKEGQDRASTTSVKVEVGSTPLTSTISTTEPTTSTTTASPSTKTSIFHRPTRRTTTSTTTRRPPTTKLVPSSTNDDLDGGDDDVITDDDYDINNNISPRPDEGDDKNEVDIDLKEEETNLLFSNVRVSNLPKLSFISQSGVLAGIIAGSIVILLCLILFIMFLVYRVKRKSEPAFERSARSPVKAGYKKALDKDMYG